VLCCCSINDHTGTKGRLKRKRKRKEEKEGVEKNETIEA
jgi:hypothetical protein